ncbi:hypothetical protein LTR70_006779 [Exophiala xenobiotica]|uniref:Alpha/beta hydrolase fold-3 domain-containing protein n=1 Tax=Lithohypha guttulata TaxID=1690604 RepID=A0ABR0K6D6_9EURO|nr:hypothetical protein LTR24_006364 [Lithohypha guttulata]KAK5315348.1 hypothetical protein LTR70_006779 [Exophiala xenobiotica]
MAASAPTVSTIPATVPTTAPSHFQNQSEAKLETPETPSTTQSVSASATNIETRTDLSPLYRLVHALIRPLRPKLVSFDKTWPEGSARLPKRPSSHYGVKISERRIQVPSTPQLPLPQADPATNTQNLWMYDFQAQRSESDVDREGAKTETSKTIYYFAGGGFQAPASGEHWKLCARLAKYLASDGVRIVIVSYPLSPKSPAKDSLPLLRAWLQLELKNAHENSRGDGGIILMGDSAGGNIVVSLAFWWAEHVASLKRELEGRDLQVERAKAAELETMQALRSVIVMSPPFDFRNINEEIAGADKKDPVLTKDLTNGAATAWVKDWPSADGKDPKADPTLSPNLQTAEAWAGLRESRLTVHGLFGTADVLSPDCKVFMQRCQKESIRGDWLVWEGQMHYFPLTQCYMVPEGKEGVNWLCRRVRES